MPELNVLENPPAGPDSAGSTEKEKPLSADGLKTGRKVLNILRKRTPLSKKDSLSCRGLYMLCAMRLAISFSDVAIKKSA